MNISRRCLFLLGVALVATAPAYSQDYIVPNGVAYSTAGLSAVIHVMQSPTNGDYSGFILRPQFKTPWSPDYYAIFSFDPGAPDEGVRTFITSQNDPISLEPIRTGAYTELVLGNYYDFDPGVPFYLGFYTGHSNGAPPGAYSNPVFGWGEFVNNQGVIQMLDSAMEVGGGGIYVGTQTIIPIPEPGFLSLSACGALIFGWLFRRLNPAASGNGAITTVFHTERSGRAMPEQHRSASPGASRDALDQTRHMKTHLVLAFIVASLSLTQGFSQAVTPSSGGAALWGQPVEGVSVRLRAGKARWVSNEIATFRLDVRNQGQREFHTVRSQEAGRLQVDGVWYDWTGAFDLKVSPLPPKREYRDIAVSLGGSWKGKQEWRDKTKAPPPLIPLQLSPGKHTVRFAAEIRDTTVKPKPRNNYVPSNPVEIEIWSDLK